jgi:hypothetical protein
VPAIDCSKDEEGCIKQRSCRVKSDSKVKASGLEAFLHPSWRKAGFQERRALYRFYCFLVAFVCKCLVVDGSETSHFEME